MNSEKVISNIKKAIKEHLDNNYAYDMLVDFELDVIDWNSLFEYIDKLQQENKQLKNNWNYIKKMLKEARQEKYISGYCGTCTDIDIDFLLDKMQELQVSDSNE